MSTINSTLFCRFSLDRVSAHDAGECFQDCRKNSEFPELTPQKRRGHEGGEYCASNLTEPTTCRGIAYLSLGINPNKEKVSNLELQSRILEYRHCVEMKQIDKEIKRFKPDAEDTPFSKDGESAFFFLDNQNGTVSVMRVFWHKRLNRMNTHLLPFDHKYKWHPGSRFVSRSVCVATNSERQISKEKTKQIFFYAISG